MANTSSIHVRKRQYQPSISSYFNRDVAGAHSAARSPLSPPLPAETQASLLSVGMRVRKSVPEGYKTHKTLGMDGFPFPSSASPASTAPPRARSEKTTRTTELMPFCGLHKTGGMQWQAPPPSSAPAALERDGGDEEDDLPSLSRSQQTISSTQGSMVTASFSSETGSNKKRSYDEDIEDDMDAFFDEVDAVEMRDTASRRIAKPKATLRHAATDGGSVMMADAEDFDEAPFLAPMDVDRA